MSGLSPQATPARCPSCHISVSSADLACPNCGQQLRESDLEIIAAQYKNHIVTHKRKRSYWISISLILFSLFWALGVTGMSMNGASQSNFIIGMLLLSIYFSLTVLSFFRPFSAAVIALSVFGILASLVFIGLMANPNKLNPLIKYSILLLLAFPACQITGMIRLKKNNREL